jgi:glycosyltransferase involved in cell wall biosynthesis
MVGRNPGYVTTQGLILAEHFARDTEHSVLITSSNTNRYLRLAEMVSTLLRNRRSIDIQCLEVYSGRSFVVEDVASWIGKRLGQRIVMVLHGGALPEFMARFPRWTKRVLARADRLVAPSRFLARAAERYGFQVQVIPNIVDVNAYPFRHRRELSPRLFWMRSFHPIWNPEMAVRVLASLREKVPEATLVMAGQDKGMQLQVKRLTESLGLNGQVRFPGFLDMQAKIHEGSVADIFINTNRIDNMPVAVVEACAMGLPVVSTAVGGIPDLLTDGETGLLVPDDDDQAMVRAIHHLLKDPDLAGRLSMSGRRLAEQSSWEHVRPQWEGVFTQLIGYPKLGKDVS